MKINFRWIIFALVLSFPVIVCTTYSIIINEQGIDLSGVHYTMQHDVKGWAVGGILINVIWVAFIISSGLAEYILPLSEKTCI